MERNRMYREELNDYGIVEPIISGDHFFEKFRVSQYKNNFSFSGAMALFNYMNKAGIDRGEPIEFNLAGIATSYKEYTYDDFINEQADIIDGDLSIEEQKEQVRDYLNDYTEFIEIDNNSFITGEF